MQTSGTLTGLDILVVEDDDDTRFFITTVLEMDGATVI
ncbi:response regulator, partial [Nostoc cf. edaphicum LEGE 07299]|nr:response regulator [Nostoc cf. edaphicum LEGE 07299]